MEKNNKDKLAAYADIIESTLDSFGIRARVSEIEDEKDYLVFNLEIVMGTPIEDIERRSKDLALALAAPDGDVKIIAPLPGRSLISIIVSKPKKDVGKKNEKYKIIRVKEKVYVTFDSVERLRKGIAMVCYLASYAFSKLGEKVDTEYKIGDEDDMPKQSGLEKKMEIKKSKPVRYWLLLIAAFVLGMFVVILFLMSLEN